MIDPFLEKQYNVRNRVPDFLNIFQDWATRSAEFRQLHPNSRLNLRYDQNPKGTFDLFLPHESTQPVPVHVFIHGGYWQALDKDDFSFIAAPFVAHGVGAVIMNYDLCPSVPLSHIVEQARSQIIYLWENAEELNVDPEAIHISGHSAGGHLVGELMTTDWLNLSGHHLHNKVIKSGLNISGLFDLTPLLQTTINTNIGLDYEAAKALSPAFKTVRINCPAYNVYGEREGDGFQHQAELAHNQFVAQGLSSLLTMQENATHFDVLNSLADPASPTFQWAIHQMR